MLLPQLPFLKCLILPDRQITGLYVAAILLTFITNVLIEGLNKVIHLMDSSCQAAFVSGRFISDQILFMQELVRNYHRNTDSPRRARKTDIMKAFASVSWQLILDILEAFHLPVKFIK